MRLVEQSWDLRVKLSRNIEIEKKQVSHTYFSKEKIDRLIELSGRAYSRYLRRLNRYWLQVRLTNAR